MVNYMFPQKELTEHFLRQFMAAGESPVFVYIRKKQYLCNRKAGLLFFPAVLLINGTFRNAPC